MERFFSAHQRSLLCITVVGPCRNHGNLACQTLFDSTTSNPGSFAIEAVPGVMCDDAPRKSG